MKSIYSIFILPVILCSFTSSVNANQKKDVNNSASLRARDGEHGIYGYVQDGGNGGHGEKGENGRSGGNGGNGGSSDFGNGGNGGNGGDAD